jgi:Zn-dependent protease with chaperone function
VAGAVSPGARIWDAHYLDGQTPLRRPVRVTIGSAGLEITFSDGSGSRRWPLAEVRQTQGFYEGEEVRLERGADLTEALLVRDVGFLRALRAAAPAAASAFHDPGRRRYRVALTLLAAVGAVGLAAALYVWGIPALASVLAARVPVSWEIALGNAVMAELAPPKRRCVDPQRQAHIDAITATLVRTLPQARYPIRVTVVNQPTINALATPGGSIVVLRGLLDRTESAEELAGVLAHEIQHVMHRHATKAILRQASAGVLVAALVGDVSAVVAFGIQSAHALGSLRYSRDAELEADRDGIRMLHAAAVDPSGMVAFFRGMQREEGGPLNVTRYLSTHPAAADRVSALNALAATPSGPPVKLLPDVDWSDVKKICGARPGSDR